MQKGLFRMETPQKDLTSLQKQLLPLKMQLYPSVEKRASGVVAKPTAEDHIKIVLTTLKNPLHDFIQPHSLVIPIVIWTRLFIIFCFSIGYSHAVYPLQQLIYGSCSEKK